jgi:aspartokinase/homoserine dehydrogenase 1
VAEPWIVHKFGGTSVATAERYRGVVRILADLREPRQAVVVSAMGGLTDALLDLVSAAARRDQAMYPALEKVRERLYRAIDDLLHDEPRRTLRRLVDGDLADLADVLRATWLLGAASREATDLVSGYGELWSAATLAAALRDAGRSAIALDAREVLQVEWKGAPTPELRLDESRRRLEAWLATELPAHTDVLVITGFVASDARGVPTTLGRNGSDYSASIFSALLGSKDLTIWTDVDGVLSADPRVVPEAVVLPEMSYREAMELAYFGAKVLHPSTLAPAVETGAVVKIRNTFAPDRPGTRIWSGGRSAFAVKGFATIDGMALVNLEGSHMIGVPGIAMRLFSALKDAGVSVVMISQASSEHSICFVVPERDADATRAAVERAFFAERVQGAIQSLEVVPGCAILAAVGDEMAGQVGVAARFFQALGDAHVNVRAIAQGSSERNISVVVDAADQRRALRAAHAGFYLSRQTLSIGLLGPGTVGSALLGQLAEQADHLRRRFNLDLRVRAIADSRRMALAETAIELPRWREALDAGEPVDLDRLVAHVHADHLPHAVLVDCTASEQIGARYGDWLRDGIHVVTPNKKANSGPLEGYQALRDVRGVHYLYETTVGAGLPILHTVRDLVQTGDAVTRIEGILSGTLSYLFNVYDGSVPFSSLVRTCKELGYTEPDPRDDLSGTDVARKIVILAREAGFDLELADVALEGLAPPALAGASVGEFLDRLSEHDGEMEARVREARDAGQVLRFVGAVDRDGASVGLRRYPKDHAFARIHLTDNIVQFTTRRYADNPLVVQGPGAGPDVTAGGIFADLLRLGAYLGASR